MKRRIELIQTGQSLTELSISMMFLLILLVGVVDFGRAFFTYIALRDAAQEGALYGSINPALTSEIKDHVIKSSDMINNLVEDKDISVEIIGSPCTGNGIRVQVSYEDFPITMPFLGSLLGTQTIPLKATVIDTILSPSCH